MNIFYTIPEFESLSLKNKFEVLISQGVYISYKYEAGMAVYLFSYNIFFVEVWKSLKKEKPDWIRIIDNNTLESYFREIDLQDLLPIS